MLRYDTASRQSQGARPYQEDAAAVWPGSDAMIAELPASPPTDTLLLAVLADGMGGHAGGALASNLACAAFLARYAEGEDGVAERLMASLDEANSAIARRVDDEPGLQGMGATFVALAFGPESAHWVSVGDSPLYLFRRGELARLNEDHSLAPLLDKLVASGKLTPEAAKTDPRRHYLRSAVTGEDLDLVDASERPLMLEGGDILVLASDGLLTFTDDEIRRVVQAFEKDTVDEIADALMRGVMAVGDPHQDNTSVIVVRVMAG